jgi:hypothetical protein
MKKKVLFVAALFVAATTFAQDGLTSKKGEAILPEAGDWAIGFDAMPFLNYGGNLLNGNTGNSFGGASWTPQNTNSLIGAAPTWGIYGKMYKDEHTAYRGTLRIGFGSMTQKNTIDTSTTTLTGEITDERKYSNFNLVLGGGIEKRRGNTRIQGYYGGEALISFATMSTTYTYADAGSGTTTAGNLHTASYTDWTAFDAGSIGSAAMVTNNNERTTKNQMGSTFGLTLRGFIGVEWFVAPKVSIGAEYGWGIRMSSTGNGERDTENYAVPTGSTDESNIARKHVTGGKSTFGLDTDVSNASLKILFHF